MSRKKFAFTIADVREMVKRLSNWGRWGDDDELCQLCRILEVQSGLCVWSNRLGASGSGRIPRCSNASIPCIERTVECTDRQGSTGLCVRLATALDDIEWRGCCAWNACTEEPRGV